MLETWSRNKQVSESFQLLFKYKGQQFYLQVLYQIMQRHHFIPEAVTADFQIHWGQHLLRPEFVESTYFLHKATQDLHYLEVGKQMKMEI